MRHAIHYQPDDLSRSLGKAYKLLSGLAKLTSLVVSLLHGLYGLLRLTMLKEAYRSHFWDASNDLRCMKTPIGETRDAFNSKSFEIRR